jgi:microcystin-dependent protein
MAIISGSVPPGVVFAYAGATAPAGYLLCDGTAISRTTYAALFAAISTNHGSGDGSTTFNLPDHRGRFLRGVTGVATTDPDASGRTAMASGGLTGNNVGSVQGHAYQTHTHTSSLTDGATQVRTVNGSGTAAGASTGTGNANLTIANASPSGGTSQASSNETRPVNAYVNYIIKI